MLKTLFALLVFMHGFIHLLGFVKAFKLAQINQLTKDISKLAGSLWFINTFLFIITILVFLLKKEWWWITGIFAVILSQILIISQWQDAKFGTIVNLIILIPLIIGFACWNFNVQVDNETKRLLSENVINKKIITEETIRDLPVPVQKWLKYSKVIGKGASFTNMVIFLGSWATLKIPQLMIEIKFLGLSFTLVRFVLTLLALAIIGLLMEIILRRHPDKAWLERAEKETEQKVHGKMKI